MFQGNFEHDISDHFYNNARILTLREKPLLDNQNSIFYDMEDIDSFRTDVFDTVQTIIKSIDLPQYQFILPDGPTNWQTDNYQMETKTIPTKIDIFEVAFDPEWCAMYGLRIFANETLVFQLGEFEDWLQYKTFKIKPTEKWVGIRSSPHPQICEAYRINFEFIFADVAQINMAGE